MRVFIVISLSLLILACGGNPEPDTYDPTTFPAELIPEREKFEATRRKFVRIIPKVAEDSPLKSQFRGTPYWPASKAEEYPRDAEGRRMFLLAQINFEEVPPLAPYPDSGMLQFFISADMSFDKHVWGMKDPMYGQALTEQDYFRVVYHRNVFQDTAQMENFPVAGENELLPVDGPMGMDFDYSSEVIYPVDYEFEKVFDMDVWGYFDSLGEEATRHLNEYFTADAPDADAKIGGYGNFVQTDPREQFDGDWIILLWMESFYIDQEHESMWGDAGTAIFAIEPERLRNKDFSNVLYSWDNH